MHKSKGRQSPHLFSQITISKYMQSCFHLALELFFILNRMKNFLSCNNISSTLSIGHKSILVTTNKKINNASQLSNLASSKKKSSQHRTML
jgi:hypothetical protein